MRRLATAFTAALVTLACTDAPATQPAHQDESMASVQGKQPEMQGRWIMVASVPGLGTFPIRCTFRQQNNACEFTGTLPLTYREFGADVAWTVEIPRNQSPTGAGFTMVFRGTKTSETTVSGRAILITDTPDASAIGYQAIPGTFTGTLQ